MSDMKQRRQAARESQNRVNEAVDRLVTEAQMKLRRDIDATITPILDEESERTGLLLASSISAVVDARVQLGYVAFPEDDARVIELEKRIASLEQSAQDLRARVELQTK